MKNQKPGESATPVRSSVWTGVLKAGVQAQRLMPRAVCVGGTAAALYAGHRFSQDTDHVMPALRDHFEEVRARLETQSEWKTARVNLPVPILGSIGGVEVAKALCAAAPFDLDEMELPRYKELLEKWHRWETTRAICRRFGVLLGEALVQGGN